ncbi:MAG TPA: polysaccharide biosynthesis/export family protein [Candidatus Binatia bacterium]|nr:polysaccharide biosynthesis/export family protein [Candidatus Binatia bacterium]
MKSMPLVPVLLAMLALGACAGAGHRPAPSPPPNPADAIPDLRAYRLGVGDRLRIDVYGEGDLSMDALVSPTGQFNYPLLGVITALNRTAQEIAQDLTTRLANGYLKDPDVRVSVVQYRPFYAIGQVQRPGAYPYVVGLTVEKALALAGGLTTLASTRKIYLLHEDKATSQRSRAALDTLVLPGDTLMVEESLF